MGFDLSLPSMAQVDWATALGSVRENIRAIVQADAGLFTNGLPPERSRTFKPGEWTTPAYSGANFIGGGSMTWTVDSGDVVTYQYTLIGKLITVVFRLLNTTVGGTLANTLSVRVPGGFTAAKTTVSPTLLYNDNGAGAVVGTLLITATNNAIGLNKLTLANWSASTNNTEVNGVITFEVQ